MFPNLFQASHPARPHLRLRLAALAAGLAFVGLAAAQVLEIAADGSPAAAPHDPNRAITKNRQPGKCCDTGCTTPGQPVMVDLPDVQATLPSRRAGLSATGQ